MPQSTARQEASYRITISDQITNGKITVQDDIKSAEKGARITLIIKPDIYHKLATLIYTVNGASTDIYPRYNEAMQTCSITMPEGDMEIFGTFARQVHKLSIAVDPPEGGEVTSTPANTAITEDEVMADLTVNTGFRLKKDPDKGFDSFFAADTEGNVNWLEPPSDSFIMPDSDVTIYALLEKVYSVTIFTSDPSIANISLRNAEGAPASLFTEGESVSVSVNVLNNYYTLGAIRANWNTLGINGDGEVSKGFIMPQGDVILVATFVPNPANSYSIAIDSDIENGSITPQTENGTYRPRANADERIYLDIQPQPGYEISGLSVTGRNTGDEVAVSPGTSLRPVPSFMMPTEPVTVTGTFVRKYLYLTGTANPPEGGRVVFTSQGTQITRSRLDDNVTVRVTPETSPKYRIKTDGVSYIYTDDTKTTYTILLSGSSPYSLTMPAYDINVDAEFERLYSVTAEVPDASRGTLTITRQGGAETDEFAAGDTVRVYPIVTDDNYVIDTVTVSGMADPITNRFTMPARDVTVTLTFRLNSNILYKINQVAGSTGSVTPMTAAVNGNFLSEAPAGATAYLDIKAASGYEIDSLGYMINKAPPVVPIDKSGYPASRPSFKIPEMTSPFDTVDITASFVKINYNLKGIATLAGGGSGGGTVEFPGQGTPPKAQIGDAVTVLVTPKTSPKYRLNKVEISGGTASASIDIPLPGTSPYTTQIEMPAGDVTVNAEFARLYKVTKDVQDANGLPRGDVTIARQGGAETDEFAAGDTVRVYTSVTDENYVIDVITVSGISGAINNRFTMPAGDVTVTVTFKLNPALMYKVNGVTRSTGLVTPVTAGGGFLSEAPVGTTVFLDISPSPGYELGTLECWKNKTETPVAIAMNGYPGSLGARPSFEIPAMSLPTDTVDISATFVKINYDLTGIASITGGGTGGGTVKFFSGSTEISTAQIGNSITAEVSPSASPSYRLTKVEVNDGEKTVTHNVPLPGTSVFAVNNIQVLAHGVTVTAYFTRLYTVSLSAPPGSDGDVLIRNSAGVIVPGNEFAAGDTVMIETNPSTGYKLGAINVNQGVGTLTGNTFTMPGGNVTVTVTFTKITYTITPVTTANGTINAPSGAFYNDTVTLDPQPNAGYEISSLYYNAGSGNVTVSTSEKTFTMPDSNVTVGGSFTRKDLNLSVASFTGGSISGLPGTALLGNSVTFNVTPAAYYRHTAGNVTYSWSGGSGTPLLISQSGGTFTYRFTMPAYDTTVSAVFDPLYAVTVTSDPSGAGTATARNENGVITALFAEGDAVNIVVSITDS
ncbi:MAG: hypothetical protein FWH38_01390, partial [Treponema sp.]|nr:hypothetical protein [Treponema sp.]